MRSFLIAGGILGFVAVFAACSGDDDDGPATPTGTSSGTAGTSSGTDGTSGGTSSGGTSSGGTSSSGDSGAPVEAGADSGKSSGTFHVTYNLDKAGDKSFDCVYDKHQKFVNHTKAGLGGSVTASCGDGAGGLDVVIAGFNVPRKVGTFDESAFSAVTFSKGTFQLDSPAAAAAKKPPEHTIKVTAFDDATNHIAGEANESISGKGNSGTDHTLTMKITFDITCERAD